jgi:uncharacterized protein (TIGR02271 family)
VSRNDFSAQSDCSNTVYGLFRDEQQAELAIEQLHAAGISKKQIGVAVGGEKRSGIASRMQSLFDANERDEFEGRDATDTLSTMCVSPSEADACARALRSGAVLVSAHVDGGNRSRVESILHSGSSQPSAFFQESGSNVGISGRTGEGSVPSDIETSRIQLLGQTLRVHKERVQRGEVRLGKQVVSERQTVEVPVIHEEVIISRHAPTGSEPVNGRIGESQEVRVPVSEERVRVEKRPVVREEVAVEKRANQRIEQVSEDVQHEELRVDQTGDVNVTDDRNTKRRAS